MRTIPLLLVAALGAGASLQCARSTRPPADRSSVPPGLTGRWVGAMALGSANPRELALVLEFREDDSILTDTGSLDGYDATTLVCWSWIDTLRVYLPNDVGGGIAFDGVQEGHSLRGRWEAVCAGGCDGRGTWYANLQ